MATEYECDDNAMDSEERFWIWTWVVICIGIVLITAIITTGIYLHDKNMVDNGYEQVSELGQARFMWQKIK